MKGKRKLMMLGIAMTLVACTSCLVIALDIGKSSLQVSVAGATVTRGPTNTVKPSSTPVPPTLSPTATETPRPTETPLPKTATAMAKAQATDRTAKARQATGTAVAIIKATAAIEAYRRTPPRGLWSETVRGLTVTVYDFSYSAGGGGMRRVALGVRVDNDTAGTIHVSPSDCTLVDLDGATYAYSAETFFSFSNPLQAVDVAPGNFAYGGIVFEIPVGTGPGGFIYRSFLGPTVTIDIKRQPDQAD